LLLIRLLLLKFFYLPINWLRIISIIIILLFLLCLTPLFKSGTINATNSFNFPHLKWFTVETNHFFIHYHAGTEYTASRIIRKADQIHQKMSEIFSFTPDNKINVVVRDENPIANGLAESRNNHITIWATRLNLISRGVSYNSLTAFIHELAHVFSLQLNGHFSRYIREIQFEFNQENSQQNKWYESDFLINWPYQNVDLWWAEGMAEFITDLVGFNKWNSFRDMFLRAAILENHYLNLDELCLVKNKSNFFAENIYIQGYDLIKYLYNTYGKEKFDLLLRHNASNLNLAWINTLQKVLEIPPHEFFDDWLANRKLFYQNLIHSIGQQQVGTPIFTTKSHIPFRAKTLDQKEELGINNYFIKYSPNKKYLAYFTNRNKVGINIFQTQNLSHEAPTLPPKYPIKLDLLKKEQKPVIIETNKKSNFSFSHDEKFLVYSKSDNDVIFNPSGLYNYDLWLYNLDSKQKEQLTFNQRARHPIFSPDDQDIFFVSCFDLTCSLGQFNLATKKTSFLINNHNPKNGTWLSPPTISPSSRLIALTTIRENQYNIILLDKHNLKRTTLTSDNFTYFHPVFYNNSTLLFSSDRENNIFNIYAMDIPSKQIIRLTNVDTGAFSPSPIDKKSFFYSKFSSFGLRIHYFKLEKPIEDLFKQANSKQLSVTSQHSVNANKIQKTVNCKLKTDDCKLKTEGHKPKIEDKPLQSQQPYSIFSSLKPLTLIPKLKIENDAPSAELNILINDHLDKLSFGTSLTFGKSYAFKLQTRINSFYPNIFLMWSFGKKDEKKGMYVSNLYSLNEDVIGSGDSIVGFSKIYFHYELLTSIILFPLGRDMSLSFQPTIIQHSRVISTSQKPSIYYRSTSLDIFYKFYNISSISPFWGYRETLLSIKPTNSLMENSSPFHIKTWFSNTEFFEVPSLDDHYLNMTLILGFINKIVDSMDQFTYGNMTFSGNTSPSKITYPMSGYQPWTLNGEALFVWALGYKFPIITEINYKWSFLYFTSLSATLFTSIGNIWKYNNQNKIDFFSRPEHSNSHLLSDMGTQLKIKAYIHNSRPWNSIIRFSYALSDVYGYTDMNRDRLYPANKESKETVEKGLRIYLSIGTNF